MSTTAIGTCGRCGGRVSVPTVWMGTIPPTPTCESCGAVPLAAHGPVLPMQPVREFSVGGYFVADEESPDGAWVRYEDAAKLQAERDELVTFVQLVAGMYMSVQADCSYIHGPTRSDWKNACDQMAEMAQQILAKVTP